MLSANIVVVVDNLTAHKEERVKMIEGRGCELMYLPPYTSDFSPIEEAFSKFKNLLPKAESRTRDALVEAIGRTTLGLTVQDARSFFKHCGYWQLVQLL